MTTIISASNGLRHVGLSCSICQPYVKKKVVEKPKQLDYKAMYHDIKRKVQLEKAEDKLEQVNKYSNRTKPNSKKYPKVPVGHSPDVSHEQYERWLKAWGVDNG